MKKCPYCNAALSDESNFCLYCMSSLDQKQKAAVIYKEKRKVLPIILILSTILIIFAVFFVAIAMYGSSNNKDDHVQAENFDNSKILSADDTVDPEIIYTYRKAVIGDDYSSSFPIDENDIVITGISTVAANGIYNIPDTIDGHRVIAIDPLAFSEKDICETVRRVIISDGIKTVWDNAFAGCINMSDIYLAGNSIHIAARAFSEKRNTELIIHCSDNCDDRNFRLYKNNAQAYGATYEYWDGSEVIQ